MTWVAKWESKTELLFSCSLLYALFKTPITSQERDRDRQRHAVPGGGGGMGGGGRDMGGDMGGGGIRGGGGGMGRPPPSPKNNSLLYVSYTNSLI